MNSTYANAHSTELYDLRVNDLVNPIGIDTQVPVFSWKMRSDIVGQKQTAYRIIVASEEDTVWDSGKIQDNISVGIAYNGEALNAETAYNWSLTVWDKNDAELTAAGTFFVGLLSAEDWEGAQWISLDDAECAAPVYRKSFEIASGNELVSAILYTTALGVYDVFINGKRVGKEQSDGSIAYEELKPGFTEALLRKFYSTFDVTSMLGNGVNAISAFTASGWWSGKVANNVGKNTALRAKLVLVYADNSYEIIVTDTSWKVCDANPIISADIFNGESYNANISSEWKNAGFDDSEWKSPLINTEFSGKVTAFYGSPITVRKDLELSPKSITIYAETIGDGDGQFGKIKVLHTYGDEKFTLKAGEAAVVDMGQNHAGWEYFEAKGINGTVITIRHGEMLNDNNGIRERGNDGPEGSLYTENLRTAKATTEYTMNGNGVECYHPCTTFYGYRYMSITATTDVTFNLIRGQVVTSVEKDIGFMKTSDESVNKLISNIKWGQYSNYLSVPTDCPQRDERQGWTADTQNFSAAGCYLGFSKSFLMKFMQDMRDSQDDKGAYPSTAPTGEYEGAGFGQIGWADAGIIIPYNVYMIYGDKKVITENWESMKKYMDVFMASTNKRGGGHNYGDWLAYESNDTEMKSLLGVAYYAWDALLMSKMAREIGLYDDAVRYMNVYMEEKEYFRFRFIRLNGSLRRSEQTACLYALYLNLLPNEESRLAVENQLIYNIESNGYCLQTGFLGTEILMNTLTKIGRSDIAYKLLLQHKNPSWLYSVDQGASTIWERWNSYVVETGFGDVGMNSFNHYSYGSVAEWMFRYMAGISYDTDYPGFEHALMIPHFDMSLPSIEASYESAYGTFVSHIERANGVWSYNAVIPANTSATFRLPADAGDTLTVNGKAPNKLTTAEDGIYFTNATDDELIFEALPGKYSFEFDYKCDNIPEAPVPGILRRHKKQIAVGAAATAAIAVPIIIKKVKRK